MNNELEKKLIETFPNLYRQYNLSAQETCMCWGFECPDSWFVVIWELSEEITNYCQEHDFTIEVAQVKEKFGGLRFYLDVIYDVDESHINAIYQMIDQAEKKIEKLETERK